MSEPTHQVTTLDNGLRVVTENFPRVRSIALSVMMGVGSRNETRDQSGLSHFLEHLLFKGTDRFSSLEIDELFDGIGAEINASTDKEATTVYARFLDRHLGGAFDVISDMVMRSTFPDIDSERQVVIEEIAMYEDEPSDKVHDILGTTVFGDTPLGRPIIGRADVVGTVSVPEIAAYRDAQYLPENIVIAAAGAVDHDDVVALARDGGFERAGDVPARVPAMPAPIPSLNFFEKDTEQVHVALGASGLTRGDDRRFAMSVLNTIFGSSSSSRLFQEVREKRGLAYAVYSYSGYYRDSGQIGMYVGTRPDRVAEAMQVFGDELRRLVEDPASPDELARAKENVKGRTALAMESPMGRMSQIGANTLFETPIYTLEEIERRVDALTIDDLRALVDEFYRPERFSVAAVGPSEEAFRPALTAINAELTELSPTV
ncbi:MAG: insulinase family protein [Actinobacteria bacterium]|nr:insulinase family protein [Actinomycetota bacterium]